MKRLFSIILAVILTIALKYFVDLMEIIEHGPDSNKVRQSIYKHEGKYFKFKPKVCVCPTSFYKKIK